MNRLLIILVLFSSTLWAQEKLSFVPTFENCSYYADSVFDVSVDKAWDTARFFRLNYREAGSKEWREAFAPYYDESRLQLRGTIMNLCQNTAYEAEIQRNRNGKWQTIKKGRFTTWADQPPIARELRLSEMKEYNPNSGVLLSGIKGREKGWVKIVGDVPIEAPADVRQALELKDCDFLILEGFTVTGGRIDAITIRENCSDVRILRADISAWGRVPVDQVHLEDSINYPKSRFNADNACYIDDEGVVIRNDAGIYLGTVGKVKGPENVVIERCYIHDPNGTSNSWHGVRDVGRAKGVPFRFWHPQGPQGVYMRSRGGLVIRYNDVVGADFHRLHDCLGGFDNGKIHGGLNTDADVYGNFLAFSQDDGLELDGGQCNVRLYNNRIEQARVGVSTAPNVKGPSYILRNVIHNLGDSNREYSYGFKNGGGTQYSKGLHYYLNNTIFISGNGISSVGYGGDVDRGMFQGFVRNNLLINRKEENFKMRGHGIVESHSHRNNSFDYDLFYNENNEKNNYKGTFAIKTPDSETHAIYDNPLLTDPRQGLFTLQAASPAIGKGERLTNLVEAAGEKVDIGALPHGGSSLIPIRPLVVQANCYLLNLKDGEQAEVRVALGNLPEGSTVRLQKSKYMDWLTFGSEETLSVKAKGELIVRVQVANCGGTSKKGVFFVRLDNGMSLPISVNVN